MSWIVRAFSTSIGKKQLMALTGLALCGFLVTHLAGNFLLFVGPEAFDAYAAALESKMFLLIPAEIVLLSIFGAHVALAVRLTLENRRARPGRYAVHATGGKATLASLTMPISGLVILVFIVIHIAHFKFGERVMVAAAEGEQPTESLYWLVIQSFKDPVYMAWYVIAVVIVGGHVYHGLQSALRSLGLQNEKYDSTIQGVSRAFGAFVALGYASLPVYAFLFVDMPQLVEGR